MAIAHVYIDEYLADIVSDITLKRSYSSVTSSASFSTPINHLAEAQAQASVVVTWNNSYLFRGVIHTYNMEYKGSAISLALECSDESYLLATDSRLSFEDGTYAGDAIELLLANTTISDAGVALRSTALPSDCFVFPLNSNRLDAVKSIAKGCGGLFYQQFANLGAIAVCDTWANLLSDPDFTTTISVSDSTHLVISFKRVADPSSPSTDKATLVIAGIPFGLFNLVNLSGLYYDMNISYTTSTWRVSDMTISISASGVQTTATLVDPTKNLTS
ncbi:MAG: hypothetical protein M0Q91_09905 [Methanoregula sp.]|jgi:hypothetical protein|nr:hypothetical protein [Methanoregula sp.]